MLSKKVNCNENETESKIKNFTHASRETNLVFQLKYNILYYIKYNATVMSLSSRKVKSVHLILRFILLRKFILNLTILNLYQGMHIESSHIKQMCVILKQSVFIFLTIIHKQSKKKKTKNIGAKFKKVLWCVFWFGDPRNFHSSFFVNYFLKLKLHYGIFKPCKVVSWKAKKKSS